MKIYTKVVIDIKTLETIYEESFDYSGEVAFCEEETQTGSNTSQFDQQLYGEGTVRYAPYIESKHEAFLEAVQGYRIAAQDDSPFADYEDIPIDSAFFGDNFVLSDFPSMLDMFGKFMAGLDIDALYGQMFEDIVNSSEVSDLVAAQSSLLEDEITTVSIPTIEVGKRDINSVMSSTFPIAKSLVYSAKTKALAKYDAQIRVSLIPVVSENWGRHLAWNDGVINRYAEIFRLWFATKMDVKEFNYAVVAKDTLWPFTVLSHEGIALGVLQAAVNRTTSETVSGSSTAASRMTSTGGGGGVSQGQSAVGGALSGAATGALIGSVIPGVGTAIGAIAGGVLGFASSFF